MTARQVSIRLGVDGKAEVKRALEDVGQTGATAFQKVEQAAAGSGQETDRQLAKYKRLAEAAKSAAAAQRFQDLSNSALGVSGRDVKSARESADIFRQALDEADAYQAKVARIRETIDPLTASQNRLNQEIAEYRTLLAKGAISQQEFNAIQTIAQQRFNESALQLKNFGRQSGLTRTQLLTFQYTFNDVIASIASGLNPMTIFLQQSGQVTQAFGGVRQTFVGIARALGPVGIGVASVTALLGVGAAAWYSYDRAVREVETALQGIARTTGASADELSRSAEASAAAANISVAAARDIQLAFLRTGRVGTQEIESSIAITRDFAATMAIEIPDAAQQLAKALADPVRGADELNAKLQFLDDRTRTYIRTLVDQNNRTEAQKVLLRALVPALADAETATTGLGRAWDYVSRAASNAFTSLGQAIDRAFDAEPAADRLETLRKRLGNLRAQAAGAGPSLDPFGVNRSISQKRIPEVEREIKLLEKQEAQEKKLAAQRAADAKANEVSTRAGDVAREVTPGFRDLERLRQQQAALKAALDDPLAKAKLNDEGQVQAAYERVSQAIRDFKPPTDKATESSNKLKKAVRESADAVLALASAYLSGADAAIRGEAARTAFREQITVSEALRKEMAERAVEGARQVADMEAQAAAQRQVNDAIAAGTLSADQANDALRLEQELRPLIAAQGIAEANTKTVLTQVIDRLRAAYAGLFAEQKRSQAQELIASGREEIATLERQIGLVGASARERDGVLDRIQLENDLRRRGIDLQSTEAQLILEQAARRRTLNAELDRQTAATDALDAAASSAIDRFGDLLSEGKLDWGSWADAGRAAIQDITKEMLKLALLNPLKNAIFGSNLPTFGDAKGGILKDLGDIFADVFHSGGVAGFGGMRRPVPAFAMAGARRYHSGAFIGPDEVPAILQRGERVLNRRETRDYDRQGGRMGSPMINVTIQTPNPQAFQASQSQVASQLARAVQSGMRGM